MPEFIVILVEPKYSGNIGAVARTMMNFDFEILYLINPCSIDSDCYARSVHAYHIIDNARIFSTFDEATSQLDYLVATSSIENLTDKKHLRNPVPLDNFVSNIFNVEGKIGLIFGRENYGLYNQEIAACDIMLRIPASDFYPSLNLSHAVTIVLYNLFIKKAFSPRKRMEIGRVEKDKLFEFFTSLLDEIQYPEHKKEKTNLMFKRMMGRAIPSKWEYHTFIGVLSRTLEKLYSVEQNKP